MNSVKKSQPKQKISEEIEENNTISIDDFFKQLAEKEKDLHISSEMVIEIDESDFDEDSIPKFLTTQPPVDIESVYKNASTDGTLSQDSPSKFEEVLRMQKQILKLETERIELVEISRRRQIDFENYKKRTERERSETFLNQISSLAMQMLPVLDNFDRALDSASNLTGEKIRDSQHFFNGIVLVNQQLNEVLSDMGVSPIVSVGETFDPHLHEAVATEETDEIPPHTITAELVRGYCIGNRVIRPSMVKVSKSQDS